MNETLRRVFLVVPLVVAGAYLLWKAADPDPSVDFKYLWFAGKLWSDGISPYGSDYRTLARDFFVGTNVPAWMVYPPSWYPLARLLAAAPYELADQIWRALNGLCIVIGAAIIATSFNRVTATNRRWPYVVFGVLLGLGSATAIALSLGQTTPLLFIGLALFLRGYLLEQKWAVAAGLLILMLKPNFGLPFVVFAMATRFYWPSVLAAGIVSVLMALPAVLPHGIMTIGRDYAGLLRSYGSVPVNAPPSLSGLANLVHTALSHTLGSFLCVGLAIAAAVTIAASMKIAGRHAQLSHEARISGILLLVATTVLLVPMHTYDLILVTPVALATATSVRWATWGNAGILVGLAVIFRANNLAAVSGLTSPEETHFAGSGLASAALLLIVMGMTAHFVQALRPHEERQRTAA
jgi:hypothetical protein